MFQWVLSVEHSSVLRHGVTRLMGRVFANLSDVTTRPTVAFVRRITSRCNRREIAESTFLGEGPVALRPAALREVVVAVEGEPVVDLLAGF
jgi:hypothetical protein